MVRAIEEKVHGRWTVSGKNGSILVGRDKNHIYYL